MQPNHVPPTERSLDRMFAAWPVVSTFLRVWTDDLPCDEAAAMVASLTISVAGSDAVEAETARGMLVADWLIRTQTVAWMRLARADAAANALEHDWSVRDQADLPCFLAPLKAAKWATVEIRDAVWATPTGACTPDERAAHSGRSWEAPWAIAAQAWSNVGLEEARANTSAAGLGAARAAIWMVADLRQHAEIWNLAFGAARTAAHAGFFFEGPEGLRATRDELKRSAAELVIEMAEVR
jgi:hypothetical protein